MSDLSRAGGAPRPIAVASHMRSGTHLALDLLRCNAREVSAGYLDVDRLAPHHGSRLGVAELDAELARLGARPLLKTHWPLATGWFTDGCPTSARAGGAGGRAGARARELLARARRLYVVRDGRDVLVSLYFYARHFSGRARRQDFAAFLRDRDDFFQTCPELAGLDRASAWARHVERWLRDPAAIPVHYDDLARHPEPTLRRVMERLDLAPPEHVREVAVPAGLPRRVLRRLLAPIRPRGTSTAIRARGGGSGGWRRHFSDADRAFFEARAGAVLARLADLRVDPGASATGASAADPGAAAAQAPSGAPPSDASDARAAEALRRAKP